MKERAREQKIEKRSNTETEEHKYSDRKVCVG